MEGQQAAPQGGRGSARGSDLCGPSVDPPTSLYGAGLIPKPSRPLALCNQDVGPAIAAQAVKILDTERLIVRGFVHSTEDPMSDAP